MNPKIIDFELPRHMKVQLIYLFEGSNNYPGIYFNAKRLKNNSHVSAKTNYMAMRPTYVLGLMHLFNTQAFEFDAIISPRSTPNADERNKECNPSTDADPYREALDERFGISKENENADLTNRFFRLKGLRSALPETTLDDLINDLTYQAAGDEAKIKSLLIVDDSISSGNTVSALLHHLSNAGLSQDCKVTVTVVVKMK